MNGSELANGPIIVKGKAGCVLIIMIFNLVVCAAGWILYLIERGQ